MAVNRKPTQQTQEKKKPDFILRSRVRPARLGEDPRNIKMVTIGAAWETHIKETGEIAYSLKINGLPPEGFDGSILMMKPKDFSQEDQVPPDA
jgi:hypothetical protein